MFVTTRSGKKEPVQFDKITLRIQKLTYGLDIAHVDASEVAKKTIQGIFDGITTTELDNLSAEVAAYLSSTHPDYSKLAARIAMSNLHRNTSDCFTSTMTSLFEFVDQKTKEASPLIAPQLLSLAEKYKDRIDAEI